MSLTFARNEALGPFSMFINVVVPGNLGDRAVTPVASVQFTVYQGKSPNLTPYSDFNLDAKHVADRAGAFYAPYTIPPDAPFGPYTLMWRITLANGDVHLVEQLYYVEDVQAFQSEGPSAIVVLDGVTINARIMKLLKHVRMALRDNNPDRNYHALPPRSSREVQSFTNRVGFIWTDEELYSYVTLALADLNSNNPKTYANFSLLDFPDMWLGVLVDCACVRSLQSLAINWIQDEFGYSISGLSLDLNKGDKFNSLKSSIESGLKDRKDAATAVRPRARGVSPARWNI